jgi:predicted alpha/beta hydrolase family esterase
VGGAAGHQEPTRVLPGRRAARRLSRSFLILHGLEGSGPDHWQTWLAGRLRERGEDVRYPDLPEPFEPEPDKWHDALHTELDAMRGDRTVICHSLACLLWMLHARDCGGMVDRALLVAPPSLDEIPAIARFWPAGIDADDLRRPARETRIVCAPLGDPYGPQGCRDVFAELGTPMDLIEGGGHLNTDAGYGPWPAVEEWALSGRAPS